MFGKKRKHARKKEVESRPLASSSEVVENHIPPSRRRADSNERERKRMKEDWRRERRKLGKRKEGQKHEFISSFYEYMLSFIFLLVFTFISCVGSTPE